MVAVYCCTGKVQRDRFQELCAVECECSRVFGRRAERVVAVGVYDAQRRLGSLARVAICVDAEELD